MTLSVENDHVVTFGMLHTFLGGHVTWSSDSHKVLFWKLGKDMSVSDINRGDVF